MHLSNLAIFQQTAQFGQYVEFVPGEKASRFMEILNNVKMDKKLFEPANQPNETAVPKKPTAGLQFNFKKPPEPEKQPAATIKQQPFTDCDSFVSVVEAPKPVKKEKRQVISFKDEPIVCQK